MPAVDRRIADVDLDDVKQQEHLHDPVDIDRPGGILAQDQRVHRQVPGVLGGVFLPALIQQRRLPDDRLQPVDFP
ncbi:hypothetical protein G6F63_016284 [Rhizopus arrhizus]|nr:hypothetical protein G6F63_016284 [Rhizopus arrhizus]